jgi:biofilm PGA synthesis N-glycosyltransferase PgaC
LPTVAELLVSSSPRVGTAAGVLRLFRRERVLAVGGYESRMATEDIDLTWKPLLAGWQTAYEPHALVGDLRSFLIGPLYPAAYWTISATAALRCQAIALVRGAREQRVVWDVEREVVDAEADAVAPPR